jgi:hypothetical protein
MKTQKTGNKLFTHHKHTPATTGRVVNSAFVGLYHFNHEFYNGFGCVELSAFFAFSIGLK